MDTSQYIPMPDCPFCGVFYGASPRVIIDEDKFGEMVHITCLACHRAMAMQVERNVHCVKSIGLFTDCNARDYKHFLHSKRVTLDDVLAVHEGLHR
jgi:hypothetical protein